MTGARFRRAALALVGALAISIAGCTPSDDTSSPVSSAPADGAAATVTHVHAVDVDEATGEIRVATHAGIYGAALTEDGSDVLERVGPWRGDAMGMVRASGRILFSGHPAPDEQGPVNLGVKALSADGVAEVIALDGEVDFHAMAAHGDRVAGWDSVSGAIVVSDDGGATWTSGTVAPVRSLAWTTDGSTLIATTPDGVVQSSDGGATVEPLSGAPFLVLVASNDASASSPLVVGLDTEGVLHVSSDGRSWRELGAAPMAPEALAVTASGRIVLASTSLALISDADGLNWQSLFQY